MDLKGDVEATFVIDAEGTTLLVPQTGSSVPQTGSTVPANKWRVSPWAVAGVLIVTACIATTLGIVLSPTKSADHSAIAATTLWDYVNVRCSSSEFPG
jgi:hypothetical protein